MTLPRSTQMGDRRFMQRACNSGYRITLVSRIGQQHMGMWRGESASSKTSSVRCTCKVDCLCHTGHGLFMRRAPP
eukprot:4337801-Amphidinium_carterae.1